MKHSFFTILFLLVTAIVLNSCLGDDDELVYYDDAAIISFSLSAANQYITTTSSKGTDSTYKETVTVGLYKFHIDQLKHEIYNPDSLPVGTDAKHILASSMAKLGGTIYVKSLTSDSVKLFSTSDSLDFSKPRTFIAVSHSGKLKNEYTVKVNIHQQEGDEMSWASIGKAEPAQEFTDGLKAVSTKEKVFVFGSDGSETSGCVTDVADGKSWKQLTTNLSEPFDADAYKSVIVKEEKLFILSAGKIFSSSDGANWDEVASSDVKQLLGATPSRMYALSTEGKIVSSEDDGATWTDEEIDGDATLLPTRDISFCYNPLLTNAGANHLLVIGNGDDAEAEAGCVWGKVEETSPYSQTHQWTSYGDYDGNKYPAPSLNGMQVVAYDDGFVAIGGAGCGKFEATPYEYVYTSVDGGLSWRKDGDVTLPASFSCPEEMAAMTVDAEKNLWIICGKSAQVWRGRLNRLGWAEIKNYYTE